MLKISAVPLRTRRRREALSLTSTLSSHSLSSLTCRFADDDDAIVAAVLSWPGHKGERRKGNEREGGKEKDMWRGRLLATCGE